MPSTEEESDSNRDNYLAFSITGLSGFNIKRGVFFDPDPYVKLRVLPGSNCKKLAHHKQRYVTKQVEGTTNPTWKEQFYIQVLRSDVIELEVKDRFDRGRPVIRRFLGKLDVPVTEILERLNCNEQRYTGALSKRTPLDQISGSLSFVVGDGRSNLFRSFPYSGISNGYNCLQRASISSNDSSLNGSMNPDFDEALQKQNILNALEACMETQNEQAMAPTQSLTNQDHGVVNELNNGSSTRESREPLITSFSDNNRSANSVDVTTIELLDQDSLENESVVNPTNTSTTSAIAALSEKTPRSNNHCPTSETNVEALPNTSVSDPSPFNTSSPISTETKHAAFENGSRCLEHFQSTEGANGVTLLDKQTVLRDTPLSNETDPMLIDTNCTAHTANETGTCAAKESHTQSVPDKNESNNSHSNRYATANTNDSALENLHSLNPLTSSNNSKAVQKNKSDKEILLNLLKFVALTETARLNTGAGDQTEELVEVDIVVHRQDTSSHLGIYFVGGCESEHLILRKMGIYITRVEPQSPADLAGIKVHDRLLNVNNILVVKASHATVVNALRSAECDVAVKVERRKVVEDKSTRKSSAHVSHPPSYIFRRRSSLPISFTASKLSTPSTSPLHLSSGLALTSFPARSTAALIEDEENRNKAQKSTTATYLTSTEAGVSLPQGSRLVESAKKRHRITSRDSSDVFDEPSQDGLPPDWEACRDRHGRVFFLDHTNHSTQWERPQCPSCNPPSSPDQSDNEGLLLEAVSSTRRPGLQRQRRYNSVKGDRNYERVMRRYQSIKRVMRHHRTAEEPSSVSTCHHRPVEESSTALSSPDPSIDSSNVPGPSGLSTATTSSSAPNTTETEVKVFIRKDAIRKHSPKHTPSQTPSPTKETAPSNPQKDTAESDSLENTPGFRFINQPDFIMKMSTNVEAYNLYMSSTTIKYMLAKISRDKSHFLNYQYNKELVKFINCFRDTSKPLPKGWEMKTDASGSQFFIDHNHRLTTFFDPRLPINDDLDEPSANDENQPDAGSCVAVEGDEERLPVQSPLSTNAPSVARRPNSTLSVLSRVIEEPSSAPPADPETAAADPQVVEESVITYNDKVVAFLKQPNIFDILKERYPAVATSQSLKHKVNGIRANELAALERYGNSIQLNILLSLFESEIMAFVVPQEQHASVLAESHTLARPHSHSLAEPRVPRSNSPSSSPAMNRSRATTTPMLRNFDSKLRNFYRKLEQKGYGQGPGKTKLAIHRENLLEEAFRHVMRLPRKELQRNKLFVSFIGEEGLDYSGPSREFFFLISRELFNPYYGLFEYSAVDTYTVQISPLSAFVDNRKEWFQFAGRIIGLCLIHHCLLDAFFARPLYKILLRSRYDLSDLRYVDEQFYQSMMWMKENDITDVLELSFSVNEEMFGKIEEKDLKPNGRNIAVTEKNKKEYIDRMVKWRVLRGTNEQTNMLLRGFNEVIDLRYVSVFDAQELELVICGTADIDLKDWRQHTEYRGGYYDLHPVIQWFWLAVEKFDDERKLRLLQFVTGTSSIPYEGFGALRGPNGPKRFCIEKWGKGDCLPRAHTCFNRIDLPPYRSFAILWEKLVIAVEETSTFAME